MTAAVANPATIADVQLEIAVDAPRETVWKALTEDIGSWWHKDFFLGGPGATFRCTAKLGGWMFEDYGEGQGLIWGTITGIRAPEMLITVGDTGAEWGGPNRGMMTWNLTEDGPEKTTVRFRHALHGNVSEETRQSLDAGWRLLIEGCMKPYAETGERPAAADADMGGCEG